MPSLKKLKSNIKKSLLTIALSTFLTINSGCAPLKYGPDLISGQFNIIRNAKSIEKVLEDKTIDPTIKDKLQLIQEAKQFGIQELGLKSTKNYEKVNLTNSTPHAIFASKKDELKLKKTNWIFFKSPYLPIFSKKKALKEKQRLEEKDYDVFISKSGAYSTLGWFKDPVYKEMLDDGEIDIVTTVLHEMTHNTISNLKHMDFTEGTATFIGNQGTEQFIEHKYGKNSSEYKEIEKIKVDNLFFSCFMEKIYHQLTKLYKQPISKQEKLEQKEIIFQNAKKEFKEKLSPAMLTQKYTYFNDVELNNAYILTHSLYEEDSQLYRTAHNSSSNNNMHQTINLFKKASKKKNPDEFLRDYLKN